MKLSFSLKSIVLAAASFFIGRAFILGMNPFAIGIFTAASLAGDNTLLIFIAIMGGISTAGPFYSLFEYGFVLLALMIMLGVKNSINLRGRNYLICLISSVTILAGEILTKYITGESVLNIDLLILPALTYASAVIFLKAIEGLKEDPLRIVSDNEMAIGIMALYATVLYGMPVSVENITIAQSFGVFMVLCFLYKYGFGIGLTWTVIFGAIIGFKTDSPSYLIAYIITVIFVYVINSFIDGGRLWFALSFLIVYLITAFSHYDVLLSEDGRKALYSALLVFVLAPNKMMLRTDNGFYYRDNLSNSPEWGRIVINRVNRLADAFKRIEYTFAGETGSGIGFNDVGSIIENFTNQLDCMVPLKKTIEASIIEELSAKDILVKNILLIKNRNDHYEVYINVRVRRGSLVTAEYVKNVIEEKMNVRLLLKDESRSIVSRNYEMLCMIEKPGFECKTAVRRLSRYEDEISGDNFYIGDVQNGQKLLLIADGMGNGERAAKDSNQLIDSLEELLNAGFDKEMSIKVVNSYLSEKNKGERFSTLDMIIIDLYSGCGRIYKQGAATTFVKRGEWIEMIKSTSLPVGVVPDAACEKCMKKFYSNDMIVMVSDGLLESILFENKEDYMKELMLDSKAAEPEELADDIIDNIKSLGGNRLKDDATIIVCKIVKSL